MKHDIPWNLIEKHFAGETEKAECRKIEQWISNTAENQMIFDQLQKYYNTFHSLPIEFIPDTKAALEKVHGKLSTRKIRLGTLWKAAAVFLAILGGWWLIHHTFIPDRSASMLLVKTENTSKDVFLSDGTHVWINRHSFIKYPNKFKNFREVTLEGEAYFEVAHDSQKPFLVQTGSVQTRVVGTRFNLRSYFAEKQILVTVSEGRVAFGLRNNNQTLVTPSQKCVFDKISGQLTKSNNDNSNFLAWKTHEFHFEKETLERIFQTLSESYNFSYRFNTPGLRKRLITANFNKRTLDEILQTIAFSANIKITKEDGIYSIR